MASADSWSMIRGVESRIKVQQDGKRYVIVIDGAVRVVMNRDMRAVTVEWRDRFAVRVNSLHVTV